MSDDANRLRWQYGKLTHGADRKKSLLSLHAAWSHLEESLDVIPAQGLGGQRCLLLETFKVVLKALDKQILFIFELGVEAGLIHSGHHFQLLYTFLTNPPHPANTHRPL